MKAGSRPVEAGGRPGEAWSRPGEAGNRPREAGSRPGESGSRPREAGSNPQEVGSRPQEARRWSSVALAAGAVRVTLVRAALRSSSARHTRCLARGSASASTGRRSTCGASSRRASAGRGATCGASSSGAATVIMIVPCIGRGRDRSARHQSRCHDRHDDSPKVHGRGSTPTQVPICCVTLPQAQRYQPSDAATSSSTTRTHVGSRGATAANTFSPFFTGRLRPSARATTGFFTSSRK